MRSPHAHRLVDLLAVAPFLWWGGPLRPRGSRPISSADCKMVFPSIPTTNRRRLFPSCERFLHPFDRRMCSVLHLDPIWRPARPGNLVAAGWRIFSGKTFYARVGRRSRAISSFSISQTTLFIAAAHEVACPDLMVLSSRWTVHLQESGWLPCTMV